MTTPHLADLACSPISLSNTEQQEGVLDLSLQARFGIRGVNAAATLKQQGFADLPAQVNQAVEDEKAMLLRLSANEYWLLAESSSTLTEPSYAEGAYPVLCQDSHAWLMLKSESKADVMAKLCAVDLRTSALPVGSVVQTMAAGVNVIVVHHQQDGETVFSLLCDRAVAHYLWSVLEDTMQALETA